MAKFTPTPLVQTTSDLYPLVEIQLNGQVKFEKVIDAIYHRYQVPYQLVSADIAYKGKRNYGTLLVQLNGNAAENHSVFAYFKANAIPNTIKGYAQVA